MIPHAQKPSAAPPPLSSAGRALLKQQARQAAGLSLITAGLLAGTYQSAASRALCSRWARLGLASCSLAAAAYSISRLLLCTEPFRNWWQQQLIHGQQAGSPRKEDSEEDINSKVLALAALRQPPKLTQEQLLQLTDKTKQRLAEQLMPHQLAHVLGEGPACSCLAAAGQQSKIQARFAELSLPQMLAADCHWRAVNENAGAQITQRYTQAFSHLAWDDIDEHTRSLISLKSESTWKGAVRSLEWKRVVQGKLSYAAFRERFGAASPTEYQQDQQPVRAWLASLSFSALAQAAELELLGISAEEQVFSLAQEGIHSFCQHYGLIDAERLPPKIVQQFQQELLALPISQIPNPDYLRYLTTDQAADTAGRLVDEHYRKDYSQLDPRLLAQLKLDQAQWEQRSMVHLLRCVSEHPLKYRAYRSSILARNPDPAAWKAVFSHHLAQLSYYEQLEAKEFLLLDKKLLENNMDASLRQLAQTLDVAGFIERHDGFKTRIDPSIAPQLACFVHSCQRAEQAYRIAMQKARSLDLEGAALHVQALSLRRPSNRYASAYLDWAREYNTAECKRIELSEKRSKLENRARVERRNAQLAAYKALHEGSGTLTNNAEPWLEIHADRPGLL